MSAAILAPREPDKVQLERLLGPPALERLRDRLRRRLERGRPLTGVLRLSNASAAERRAIEALLGRPPGRGTTLAIDLDALAVTLSNAGAAPDLASAVETLAGPVTDRSAEAARVEAQWQTVWQQAEAAAHARALGGWLEALREEGLLRRLAGGDAATAGQLLAQTWRVVDALPGRGIALSTLAAHTLGDAHGLDSGRPLATLLRRVLTARYPDIASDTAAAHALWAAAGVRVGGGLTSRVAVLNLPAQPTTATGTSVAALADRGEPHWLTLRQLLEDPPAWRVAGERIYVCENIAVMAEAADRLGPRARPLVATDGQPSVAATTLLRSLRAAGATLYYHGDFDWGGLHIGNRVIGDLGAMPWRYDARAYRSAVAAHAGRALHGRATEAQWDPELASAMMHAGAAIDEERLIDELLADLTPAHS